MDSEDLIRLNSCTFYFSKYNRCEAMQIVASIIEQPLNSTGRTISVTNYSLHAWDLDVYLKVDQQPRFYRENNIQVNDFWSSIITYSPSVEFAPKTAAFINDLLLKLWKKKIIAMTDSIMLEEHLINMGGNDIKSMFWKEPVAEEFLKQNPNAWPYNGCLDKVKDGSWKD